LVFGCSHAKIEATFACHEQREEPQMLSAFIALGTLAGIAFSLALLFLPTLVARSRNHPNVLPIFLVNLFFGWTFVGWVVALVWACTRPAAPAFYAPVYPAVIGSPHRRAVATTAATILSPPSLDRRWR
jgi:hypothetical protein